MKSILSEIRVTVFKVSSKTDGQQVYYLVHDAFREIHIVDYTSIFPLFYKKPSNEIGL